MELTQDYLRTLVDSCISDETLFLVDILSKNTSNGLSIQLLIDGDEGISIDSCSEISRCVNNKLEEDFPEQVSKIEVSSPGMDYPLTSERQFRKNVGRTIKFIFEDNKEKTGKLKEVSDKQELTIEVKKKKKLEELTFPINKIIKTKIIPSFK